MTETAIMQSLFEEKKADGGQVDDSFKFVNPITWWLKKFSEAVKLYSKRILSVAPQEGETLSVFEIGSRIKKRDRKYKQIIEELFPDEKIPKYEKGTPYVPETQLAIIHKGEAVIPAKYNLGGEITNKLQKFAFGGTVGGVNALFSIEAAAEKIGETIVKKIEKAEIKLQAPKAEELPKLEISNLDELKNVFGSGPVGADKISKLDKFIESTNDKLDRLEEQTVSTVDKVKVLETSTRKLNQLDELQDEVINLNKQVNSLNESMQLIEELPELKASLESLKEQIDDMSKLHIRSSLSKLEGEVASLASEVKGLYSKAERSVDSADTKSYIDTAVHNAVSELRRDEINPVKAFIDGLSLKINDLNYKLDSQLDIIYSNISRLGLA